MDLPEPLVRLIDTATDNLKQTIAEGREARQHNRLLMGENTDLRAKLAAAEAKLSGTSDEAVLAKHGIRLTEMAGHDPEQANRLADYGILGGGAAAEAEELLAEAEPGGKRSPEFGFRAPPWMPEGLPPPGVLPPLQVPTPLEHQKMLIGQLVDMVRTEQGDAPLTEEDLRVKLESLGVPEPYAQKTIDHARDAGLIGFLAAGGDAQ